MTSKSPVRTCEDVDEAVLSYAEIKALCAGNPLIKEKMDLDIDVARLRLLKSSHQSNQFKLQDMLIKSYPLAINSAEINIRCIENDIALLSSATILNDDGFSPMIVNGVTFSDKAEAGKAFLGAMKNWQASRVSYRGFNIDIEHDYFKGEYYALLKGGMTHKISLSDDAFGNITRLNNTLKGLPEKLKTTKVKLESLNEQVKNAQTELNAPFKFEAELSEKSERLAALDAKLNMENTIEDLPDEHEMAELTAESGFEEQKEAGYLMHELLYSKFRDMFRSQTSQGPDILGKEYSYIRYESEGFDPLTIEWVGENRLSIMHTYVQNGDLMYSPMMVFEVTDDKFSAVEYEMSCPPLYQYIDEDGTGHSADGNGRQETNPDLQGELNEFASTWFDNVKEQGYMPVKGITEIKGEGVEVRFDTDGCPIMPDSEFKEKQYDLGYGHLGNGLTVWNRLEEKNGDYTTLAHISPDRTVNYIDKELPDSIREKIKHAALSSDMKFLSSEQECRVFSTPPLFPDPDVSMQDMIEYGYLGIVSMLPLSKNMAERLYLNDVNVYRLYSDDTEKPVEDKEELNRHAAGGGLFGVEKHNWGLYCERENVIRTTKCGIDMEDDLLNKGGMYGIYQVKDGPEYRSWLFSPLGELKNMGSFVDKDNYDIVYSAPLSPYDMDDMDDIDDDIPGYVLDSIYQEFNTGRPNDFKGHSLSVSDIVAFNYNGALSVYFCDRCGWVKLENECFFKSYYDKTESQTKPYMVRESSDTYSLRMKIDSAFNKNTENIKMEL